jgi:transcriptional regulator with XRE-family HTH domain
MSQEALAEKAGLDRSFLVEVETARHSVSVDRLWDVADALGVHLVALLEPEGTSGNGEE